MDLSQLAQEFDPFMDPGGETFVQISVKGDPAIHQIHLDSPLATCLVRAELAQIVKNGIPTDHQTRTAIEVIRGMAYIRARAIANHSVDHQILRKPLAQAVLAVARKGGTKKPLPGLLAMLIRTAAREGIDIKKGPWPSNEDALGKQLSSLIPLVADKGVQLIRHLNDRPRTWSISPLIEASGESDDEVTGTNPFGSSSSVTDVTSQPSTDPAEGQSQEPGLSDEHIGHMLDGVLS